MKDTLVSIKTAKLAKEKGFDIPVLFYYDGSEMIATQSENAFSLKNYNKNNGSTLISAPTQTLLSEWLRKKRFLSVEPFTIIIKTGKTECYRFSYHVLSLTTLTEVICDETPLGFLEWEEAIETGLQEALKLIKI